MKIMTTIAEGMPRMRLNALPKYGGNIAGGIRSPELSEIGGGNAGGEGIAGGMRIPNAIERARVIPNSPYGGIRTPHMHLQDDVVLLDKERFKTFVGEIARELAMRNVTEDHVGVMNRIGRLA
jgi:hypothetical protein